MVYVVPALLLLTLSQEEGKSALALKARAVISPNTCLCPSLSYPGNSRNKSTAFLLRSGVTASKFTIRRNRQPSDAPVSL